MDKYETQMRSIKTLFVGGISMLAIVPLLIIAIGIGLFLWAFLSSLWN